MTGDASDTSLALSVTPSNENHVNVYFDGVYQSKSNFSLSGSTITFSTAPPTGVVVEAVSNQAVSVGTATGIAASAITGLTEVTAADADHVLIYDATASALKKALVSDFAKNTTEEIQDIVGAMFSSNTETGIAATYEDGDGTIDLVLDAAQSNITSLGTLTTLTVDNVIVNGTTIGHTDDTDLLTLADGVLTVAGEVSMTTLDIGGTNVTASAADINLIDGITNGTVIASKAIITDSNKDITGGRNITITGELDAGSLDVSGDIDVDGTANLDNTDIDGTLNTSGVVTSQTSANISQVSLTDGTVSWDAAAAANAFLLLEENSTISAPSNAVEGAIISIEVAQHASSGPYTLAWNAIFEFAGDTNPTQTATDAKTDIYAFRYNGSKWQNIGISQNLTQS